MLSFYESEYEPVPIDKNTPIIQNNINHLSDLKNNDIVFLRHFEDMQNVYILKDVQLSNDMMLKFLVDKSEFIFDTNNIFKNKCGYYVLYF